MKPRYVRQKDLGDIYRMTPEDAHALVQRGRCELLTREDGRAKLHEWARRYVQRQYRIAWLKVFLVVWGLMTTEALVLWMLLHGR